MNEDTKFALSAVVMCALVVASFIAHRAFDDIEHNRCLMNGGAPTGAGECNISTEEKDREIARLEKKLVQAEIKLEICEERRR